MRLAREPDLMGLVFMILLVQSLFFRIISMGLLWRSKGDARKSAAIFFTLDYERILRDCMSFGKAKGKKTNVF